MFNQKVDFHSHFLSPTYLEYLERFEGPEPDHFPTPKWDLESHIAQMDQLGIAVSLISVSSPNLSGADQETEKAMVRQINLEGWSYVQRYPERLGLMASLPLPHVEDAIDRYDGPVLLIHGDGDEAVPFHYGREAAERYRNARFVPIHGDNHCYDYHLDEVLDAIKNWIGKH